MGGIEEGYLQHIRNKAILSADGRDTAQNVAEYLAREILQKRKLRELFETATEALRNLNAEEKLLLEIRYFGKIDRVRRAFAQKYAGIADEDLKSVPFWSERTYFRKQKKLLAKLTERFSILGLTRERFDREYALLDGIGQVYTYVSLGKDLGLEKKERAFLQFLANLKG